jgi:hypothetical protein
MMTEITDRIFIGSINEALDKRLIESNNVTGILSLSMPLDYQPHTDVFAKVRLYDGKENPLASYVIAVKTLDAMLKKTMGNVLVHCTEGRSRCPFIVACYIAWKEKVGFDVVLSMISSKHKKTSVHPLHLAMSGRIFEALKE